MKEIFLGSESDWAAFAAANADAIDNPAEAKAQAMDGGYEIGGGAAPLFVVYLDLDDERDEYEPPSMCELFESRN